MAAKILVAIAFVAIISQGYAVTEIRLADLNHAPYLSTTFFAKSISISKLSVDTLVSCNVIFPDGVMYETFPNNNIVSNHISSASFHTCGISFFNAPGSFNGTYELLSLVQGAFDNHLTLTRQRHHVSFYFDNSWQIP